MKFSSKIDKWFGGLALGLVTLNVLMFVAYALTGKHDLLLPAALLGVVNIGGVMPLIWLTDYTLTDDALVIRASLWKKEISYSCLRSVSTVHCFVTSPALAGDRLCLVYEQSGKKRKIYISPLKRKKFILQLCERAEFQHTNAGNT